MGVVRVVLEVLRVEVEVEVRFVLEVRFGREDLEVRLGREGLEFNEGVEKLRVSRLERMVPVLWWYDVRM